MSCDREIVVGLRFAEKCLSGDSRGARARCQLTRAPLVLVLVLDGRSFARRELSHSFGGKVGDRGNRA